MSSWSYDDLLTPTTKADYENLLNNSLSYYLKLNKNTNWSLSKEEDDIRIDTIDTDNSNISTIRLVSTIEGIDANELCKRLFIPTFESQKKLHPEVISYKFLEKISDDIAITQSIFKSPFGITNRDFLTVRMHRELEKGIHFIGLESINNQKVPFDDSLVRGVVRSGKFIIPLDNETKKVKLISIDYLDPRGSVPQFAFNLIANGHEDFIKRIRDTRH